MTDAGYEELEAWLRPTIAWTAPNLPELMALARRAADALADMRRQRDEAEAARAELTKAWAEWDEAEARTEHNLLQQVEQLTRERDEARAVRHLANAIGDTVTASPTKKER